MHSILILSAFFVFGKCHYYGVLYMQSVLILCAYLQSVFTILKVLYIQSVFIIESFICKVSLSLSPLYEKCLSY